MNTDLGELVLVPEPSEKFLTESQRIDYEQHRKQLLTWLLTFGKNPEQVKGYAVETLKSQSYRIDQFYRWVWAQEGTYTTDVTGGHAEEWLTVLAYSDKSNIHNNSCLKALKMLFKWRHRFFNEEPWESEISFKVEERNPRDYLTRDERSKIREAALEYGTLPAYKNVSPEERRRGKQYLAQRFEKPKEEVTDKDWARTNG